MIEHIARKIFFTCLYPCAVLVLILVWNGGPPAQIYFQVAASLFIIGLAAFLTWFVSCLRRVCAGLIALSDLRKEVISTPVP